MQTEFGPESGAINQKSQIDLGDPIKMRPESGSISACRPDPAPLQDFVLLKTINWFGKEIPAGTIYRQVNGDYWHPMLNYSRCSSMQIDFNTVINNSGYFLKLIR